MSWLLIIALLAIFAYLSHRNILWGVSLLIIFLPSYLWRVSFFGWPSTFLELMIWTLFIIWLTRDSLYKRINYNFSKASSNALSKTWRVLLSLWLLFSFAGVIINFSFSSIGLWRAYWLEPMMFFIILIYNIRDKRDLYLVLRSLGALLAGLFVLTIWQYFSDWNLPAAYNYPNTKRLTAIFDYPNALSLLTAPLTSFFGLWWLTGKNKLTKIWRLMIFVFGISLSVLAVSEGAIVAIFLPIFFYLILAKKTRKIAIPLAGVATLLSLIFLPVNVYWKSFQQQLFDPQLNLEATSLEIRSNQWQETTWMLYDNFIFGAGINGYQKSMEAYRQYDWLETYLYPHNIFLNFWTEIGFVGMLLFVVMLYYVVHLLRNIFNKKSILAWPLIAAWLTWFVHGLVDVPYFKNDLSVLFYILLAITLIVYKFKDNDKIS